MEKQPAGMDPECIGKAVKWTVGKLVRFFTRVYNVLPMAWQWLLTGMVLFLLLAVGVATRSAGVTLFAVILYFAAIFYGTYCFESCAGRHGPWAGEI